MYFETIHDLPYFDEVKQHHEDSAGYTSYYETDTELDSDFGNFIFNNVAGDSASLICIDDTVDLLKRHEDATKVRHQRPPPPPHYKLDHASSSSPATSPSSEEHPLERSTESKHSNSGHSSYRSGQSGFNRTFDAPPPVPPPRRRSSSQSIDLQDHTYETLDDCKGDYLAHQETIYFSKASDDSRGSQDSTAKPVSNDEGDFTHPGTGKGAEGAPLKSPTSNGKPRSSSLQLPKSPDCVQYRQRRKMSEPTHANRKRRQDKVASKSSNYPSPVKGFPTGVPEEYADYLANSVCLTSERRSPTCPLASPSQRGITASPERRNSSKKTAPLVIKHKGKTYLVPVVDKKLQKELEKRSKLDNPSVMLKHAAFNTAMVSRSSTNAGNFIQGARSFASPPKMDPSDHALPHKKGKGSKVVGSSPQKVPPKQVTHYGML